MRGSDADGPSTALNTTLTYVALRLLGLEPTHPVMEKARACLHALGGALYAPLWGKFWLAVLGCYAWEGVNPLVPELWLLPSWLPFHPSKYASQTRQTMVAMSYLYARRYQHPLDETTLSLRRELFVQPYESISWSWARNKVAKVDKSVPHSWLLDLVHCTDHGISVICVDFLTWYEWWPIHSIRQAALFDVYDQIEMEDENTYYVNASAASVIVPP
jgi:lanosterol synthase